MAKHLVIAVLSTAFLCGLSTAQNQAPASAAAAPADGTQPQRGTPRIAPGVVIPVQLTRTVDARKVKLGDEIVATVTIDLKTNSGDVIVPKDTKIMGHITAAQARTKEQKESELGIAFDRVVTRLGEMKQPMSIQAIIAPASDDSASGAGNSPGGPATGGSTAASPMGGRAPLSGAAQPHAPAGGGTDAQAGSSRPPINGNTQGVVGMPELKLEANAQNAALGSVVSSGKGNVKLESGTLMLLHVNP